MCQNYSHILGWKRERKRRRKKRRGRVQKAKRRAPPPLPRIRFGPGRAPPTHTPLTTAAWCSLYSWHSGSSSQPSSASAAFEGNKLNAREKGRTSGCGGVGGGAQRGTHSRGDRQKYRLTSQQIEKASMRDMQKRGGFRYCWFLKEVIRRIRGFWMQVHFLCVFVLVFCTHLIPILVRGDPRGTD